MRKRWLSVLTGAIGVSAIAGVGIAVFQHGMTKMDLLLLMLALPAFWMRIELDPAGHITLMPLVIFVTFAVAARHMPLLIATVASLFGGFVFQHRSIGGAFEAVGEEVAPVLFASGFLEFPPFEMLSVHSWQSELVLVVAAYIVGWLAMAMIKAKVVEGVEAGSFLSSIWRSLALNFLFFGLAALGLAYLVHRYGDTGYFTLALATIALVEVYYPYKLLSAVRDTLFASLAMIAQAIDKKDAYTGTHVWETARIAVRVARRLGLPEADMWKIKIAGFLHDIGKIGVSTKIIRKPSALDPDEMRLMRQHPVIGAEIMQPVQGLADAAEIVRHHHEHFDGSGYPDGLKDKQIPVGSRIMLVADAFHAITSDRSYRRAKSKAEALEILKSSSGKQFDPEVVEAIQSIASFL